jgi:hypothetical protein
MSAKKHTKRRRKKRRCADPALVLGNLAAALNACNNAGYNVKLRHGIVYSDAGYVLPLLKGKWMARPYPGLKTAHSAQSNDDWD